MHYSTNGSAYIQKAERASYGLSFKPKPRKSKTEQIYGRKPRKVITL